jgi:MerR family transcriptional regulator, light-induced transcriptional regulator
MSKNLETATLGIEAVAQLSGLSQHLIRIWERRYGAVEPRRTESNRRLYSEADALRLELLNRAVHGGHRISDIATLPTSRLEQLVGRATYSRAVRTTSHAEANGDYIKHALDAITQFDSEALGAVFSRADVELGQARVLEQVIMPLMEKLGSEWKDGNIRIAHEHMATAVIRNHVGALLASMRYPANAPSIVVATPAGQLHEVGALVVAVAGALEGWRPVYLGPNLPADEIAGAVQKSGARLLSDGVSLLIGGRAAEAYANAIGSVHAFRMTDIGSFRRQLDLLRSGKTTHSIQKSKKAR